MNIVLWIIQIVLALTFGFAGVLKSTQPISKLEKSLPWVKDFSPGVVRFVGVAELLGALGLILPAVTGIATILTPLAAVGLAVTMVLAAVYHGRKAEWSGIGINAVLFVLAAVVAWGRFGPYAF